MLSARPLLANLCPHCGPYSVACRPACGPRWCDCWSARASDLTPPHLLPAAYCYMARLQRGHGGTRGSLVRVDDLTAHRMMAVGTVVATKFYDDK